MNGLDIPVSKLYPPVQFPVGRGTPMISPLIKWDYGDEYFVMKFADQRSRKSGERKVKVALSSKDYKYIAGHTIDGRVLFPATGYLCLAWETLAIIKGFTNLDISVEFEDVKFLRATAVPTEKEIELTVTVQSGTGRFEVIFRICHINDFLIISLLLSDIRRFNSGCNRLYSASR